LIERNEQMSRHLDGAYGFGGNPIIRVTQVEVRIEMETEADLLCAEALAE
jgi:hypothetical protein